MNLSQIRQNPVGTQFEITGFTGNELLRERLHELGLRQGLVIEYRGSAPLGGPMILHFKAVSVALRTEEAQCLEVKAVK